jgi:hypothetical protein
MKLAELQKKFAADLMRPLGSEDEISPKVKASYIKPNSRLTSVERLEIYSRSYWFRIIDSMYDDFPGLRAIVGDRAFDKIVRAYLADCPSRSFTLRDLGSRLHAWLKKNKKFVGNKFDVALDMVALEWAHIEAWDGAEKKVLGPEDLLELGPNLRMGLQPHIRLLDLKARRKVSVARLKAKRIFVAVHRMDESIYYRRLDHDEFRILSALREGKSVGRALAIAVKESSLPPEELQQNLQHWFASWAELGWLCV